MAFRPVLSSQPLEPDEKAAFDGFTIERRTHGYEAEKATLRLTRLVNSWPEEFREAIKERGASFVLVDYAPTTTVTTEKPQKIIVSTKLLLADDARQFTVDSSMVKNVASLVAFGPEINGIDWDKGFNASIKALRNSGSPQSAQAVELMQKRDSTARGMLLNIMRNGIVLMSPKTWDDMKPATGVYRQWWAGVQKKCEPYLMKEAPAGMDAETKAAQLKFFKAYNELIDFMTSSHDGFDYDLRNRMTVLLRNAAALASGDKLGEAITRDYKELVYKPLQNAPGPASVMVKAMQKLPINITSPGRQEKDIPGLYRDQRVGTLPLDVSREVFSRVESQLPGVTDIFPDRQSHLFRPDIHSHLDKMAGDLAVAANFGELAAGSYLLSDFKKGRRALHELSNAPIEYEWEGYKITLPSVRSFLIDSIELTARRHLEEGRLPPDQQQLFERKLEAVRAAYAEATVTPFQRETQREVEEQARKLQQQQAEGQRQKQAADAQEAQARLQQQELEKQLAFTPLMLSGLAQSLLSRGSVGGVPQKPDERAAQARLKDFVQRELAPVREALNRNFQPHQSFAKAMFLDDNAAVMRAADHIAAGAKLTGINGRDSARQAVAALFSAPLEDSPAANANRERHGQLIAAVQNAPILLISALGTPEQVAQARLLQEKLFPVKGNLSDEEKQQLAGERFGIASAALQNAGIAVPESIAAQVRAPLPSPPVEEKPAEPPVPFPVLIPVVAAPAFADVAAVPAAEAAPAAPKPEVHPKQWEGVVKLAEEFARPQLAEQPPYNMLRLTLGMQPGHPLTLNLSRWAEETNGHRRVETKSTTIALNEPDLDNALDLKQQLQSHLFKELKLAPYRRLHEGNYVAGEDDILPAARALPDPNQPHPDGKAGRIIQRNGVYMLRLIFSDNGPTTPRMQIEVSLGVAQSGSVAEAESRRAAILEKMEEWQGAGRRITAQDIRIGLQTHVFLVDGKWEQAQSIDLAQLPQIERNIPVKFPVKGDDQATMLHIENPKLEGSPNPFWRVPVTVRVGGRELLQTSVNTHIQDASMLPARIAELTEHIRNGLEAYGKAHPDARWRILENGKPAQYTEDQLRHDPDSMEWTRLDSITYALPYVRGLSVHTSEPEPLGDDKVRFALSIRRADGSPFLEKHNGSGIIPVERSFSIRRGATDEETIAAIEKFRAQTHATFSKALESTFNSHAPSQEGEAGAARVMHPYNAMSMVRMFEQASRSSNPAIEALFTRGKNGNGNGHGGSEAPSLKPDPKESRSRSYAQLVGETSPADRFR